MRDWSGNSRNLTLTFPAVTRHKMASGHPDSCMSAGGVYAPIKSNIETECHGNRARRMDVLAWSWPDCSTISFTAPATG